MQQRDYCENHNNNQNLTQIKKNMYERQRIDKIYEQNRSLNKQLNKCKYRFFGYNLAYCYLIKIHVYNAKINI